MRASSLVLVVALTAGATAQEIRGMRDQAPRPATGTSALSGVIVTDDNNPQPIRRARVTINSNDGAVLRTVTTDDRGRYAIADLPANRYTLSASKPGYVRMTYGARRPNRPGTPVTVGDNQKIGSLDMKLARGSVITGRILDETGQPAFGVNVRLMQYRMQQGERVLGPAGTVMMPETTDDRGMYRLYGLAAGEYIVSATPRTTTIGEIRAMTDSEIRAAIQAAQQPGAGSQPGGIAPAASVPGGQPGGTTPPGTPREYSTVGFTPVYYPGTTLAGGAATVVIGAGEERAGVDFQLQLVRTARVEGMVIVPDGIPPQSVQLTMTAAGPNAVPGALPVSLLSRVTPGPDGKFSYTSVTPGQYTISARATQRPPGAAGREGAPGAAAQTMSFTRMAVRDGGAGEAPMIISTGGGGGGPAFWATADVNIDGANLSNVNLTLQPGMNVSGRIQFDGKRMAPPGDLTRARVSLLPVQTGGGAMITVGSLPSTNMDASGKFTMAGVTPGRYRFEASMPMEVGTGWRLKSVVVKGRDVFDFPLEIGPGEEISDAVVTFTDVTQDVSGTLQDPTGRAAPDYTIVVFPTDKRMWSSPLGRRIRTARPGTDGRFTIANLPAGDYRIAALTDIAPGEANDPAFLEQLVAASFAFTLADGEKKVQDLRIGK